MISCGVDKKAFFQSPFPPSFELFNFNTSRVSAGTEIAQTSKISQRGHKVTQIPWIIYGFCNNKRRMMYLQSWDGVTGKWLLKQFTQRFSWNHKTNQELCMWIFRQTSHTLTTYWLYKSTHISGGTQIHLHRPLLNKLVMDKTTAQTYKMFLANGLIYADD